MDTVENYLNIPINHYVSINMAGLKELVNAVGGIEVNNNLTFSQDGYDFTIGKISLDGEQALSYSRMRYEDRSVDNEGKEPKLYLATDMMEYIVAVADSMTDGAIDSSQLDTEKLKGKYIDQFSQEDSAQTNPMIGMLITQIKDASLSGKIQVDAKKEKAFNLEMKLIG